MLPDTLFFETPKKPLNDPVLFRRIGRNELLLQTVVSTRLAKSATLKDQAIVATQHRGACGSERAKPRETRGFDGPLRFLRSAA
jgi:hypothetical protein